MYMIFYKFFEKEEYRSEFLEGKLFCNKASYFRENEAQEISAKGVYDCFENTQTVILPDSTHFAQMELISTPDGRVFNKTVVYDEKPAGYKEKQAFISYAPNYNLFCLSYIGTDENGKIIKFDKRNKTNFGKYGIIIMEPYTFFSRIEDAVSDNDGVSNVRKEPVQYISYENRNTIQEMGITRKFDFFAYQQEFRLIFDYKKEGALIFNVKQGMNDIVCPIEDKSFFLRMYPKENIFAFLSGRIACKFFNTIKRQRQKITKKQRHCR